VSSISRKTVAWASGAVLAVGGCTAGIVLAVQGGGQGAGPPGSTTAARAAAKPTPLRLVSISPADGGKAVNGTAAITVTYNQPLPASAPLPVLSPAVAGAWARTGDTAVFTPATGYPQHTKVTVTVNVPRAGNASTAGTAAGAVTKPASTGNLAADAKAASASATASASASASATASAATAASSPPGSSASTATFTTGNYSMLRVQEILAQLGYLPLTWTAASGAVVIPQSAAAQLSAAYAPPAGTFQWEPGYPSQLHSFWAQGTSNTLDLGALYGFQADHNLTIDGKLTTVTWAALLKAAAADQKDTHGYSYAIASKHLPETLTIWHNGRKVFSSAANTGIGVAPTADGTYPVYEKLPYQIMSGTNPDGSHYADPVQWVSYFNGGDAVHYFSRGSYGWPQSLGCVELPYSAAKNAYPYLPYGTLVTVA
jgi:peptidoglycan hydrolase-like protein with peptidoglycan-binding domain